MQSNFLLTFCAANPFTNFFDEHSFFRLADLNWVIKVYFPSCSRETSKYWCCFNKYWQRVWIFMYFSCAQIFGKYFSFISFQRLLHIEPFSMVNAPFYESWNLIIQLWHWCSCFVHFFFYCSVLSSVLTSTTFEPHLPGFLSEAERL